MSLGQSFRYLAGKKKIVRGLFYFSQGARRRDNSRLSAQALICFAPSLCLVGTSTVLRTGRIMRLEEMFIAERKRVGPSRSFCSVFLPRCSLSQHSCFGWLEGSSPPLVFLLARKAGWIQPSNTEHHYLESSCQMHSAPSADLF